MGALTLGNLSIVRAVCAELGLAPEFEIIGMRDGEARYLGPKEARVFVVDTRSLLSPGGAWRTINAQDCVLDIGGGDSFADIYGLKRFMFLWLTKMMAIAGGTPLLLSPQTIGPFSRQPYRFLARLALERATCVVARDKVSFDFLAELAPGAKGALSVDVAFALPFEDHSAQRGGERLKVGVNVSGLLFNEAESGNNRFGLDFDYAKVMRRFVADLVARGDVQVHLVTHVVTAGGGWDDDGGVADRLAQAFPQALRAPDFAGPCEAKSYISGLDVLVAGRMHACIAAFSAGVAVVPVAYSRKFGGLFGMLGYDWMTPVKGMGDDQAVAYLKDCVARHGELTRDSAAGMQRVEAKLEAYRVELRTLLAAAAPTS